MLGHFDIYGKYPYRRYTMHDGLPVNTAYHILQDNQGYMWFSTSAGVSKFDGKNFVNYGLEHGLPDLEVLKLFQDRSGKIWCLCLNGRVCYIENNKIFNSKNTPTLKGINMGSGVVSFAEASDGTKYFISVSGEICILFPDMSSMSLQFPAKTACVFQYLDNQVCLLTEHGIFQFSGASYELIYPEYPYVGGNAFDSKLSTTHFRFFSGKNIVQCDKDGAKKITTYSPIDIPIIQSFCIDRHDQIWINTQYNGIYRIKPFPENTPELVFTSNHLTNYVFEDREGSIWITTMGSGIIQITPANQEIELLMPEKHTNDQFPVTSIMVTSEGDIWTGSQNGTIYRFKGHTSEQFVLSKSPDVIIDMIEYEGKIFSAGFLHTYCTDPKTGQTSLVKFRTIDNKIIDQIYFRRFATCQNRLFGGSYGFYEIKTEQKQWIATLVTLADNNRIDAVYMDRPDHFYLGSSDLPGLFNGTTTQFNASIQDSLQTKITKILRLDSETIAYATNGSGIWLERNGMLDEHITQENGLSSNYCIDMAKSGDSLFVLTTKGVTFMQPKENGWVFASLHSTEELPTRDLRKIAIASNHIVIASDAGIIRINKKPHIPIPSRIPVITKLHDIILDNEVLNTLENISISADFKRLQFNFAALTYLNSNLITIEYRTSSDTTWKKTLTNFVDFTSFETGNQWFEVRSKYFNSEWGPITKIHFYVIPIWYNSMLFKAFILIGLIALTWIVARMMYLKTQRQLRIVLERNDAINQERNRIARDMHDDLGADLSNLLLVTRMGLQQAKTSDISADTFSKLEQLTTESVQKIDNIIWALSSGKDNVPELINYLEKYFLQFKSNLGLNGSFSMTGMMPEKTLSANVRRGIYLVVKEVLNNSAKHARCTQIDMKIVVQTEFMEISIQDNGIGMNPNENNSERNGIKNIISRMEQIGGTFNIESKNGNGTKSTIILHLT